VEGDRRPGEDPAQRATFLRLRIRPFAALLGIAAVAAAGNAARHWLDVVEVRGGSMAPSLLAGDRLVVESRTYAQRAPRAGEVVLATDPRDPQRELIKRVANVDALAQTAQLLGDAPAESTDSLVLGPVSLGSIRWRAAFRYWPPQRLGRI
jgi:nickel-type superoxide dismutase maturation protease